MIPIEAVDQLLEARLSSPLFLSRPWVAGVAFSGDQPIVALSLELSSPPPGVVECILVLLATPGSAVRWGLKVSATGGLGQAQVVRGGGHGGPSAWPSWVYGAQTPEGEQVGWLHLPGLLTSFPAG